MGRQHLGIRDGRKGESRVAIHSRNLDALRRWQDAHQEDPPVWWSCRFRPDVRSGKTVTHGVRMIRKSWKAVAALAIGISLSLAADAPLMFEKAIPLPGVEGRIDHIAGD